MVRILTLISILITISCSEKNSEEITERFDNGNKKLLVKYKGDNGEEVILEKMEFFKEGDTLIWENYNINGKREGKWISYYENGQIKKEGNYMNGWYYGSWNSYYENGQIESKENFSNQKREGKWISYYENGQIKTEGNYKYGKRKDKWTSYDENGMKIKERIFNVE